MDLKKLLNRVTTLTNPDNPGSEEELRNVVQQLKSEVDRVTRDLDPNDPAVVKLRGSTAKMVHNIEMALAVDEEQRAADDASIARQKAAAIYKWELLPVYEWNNRFARVVGRLLSQVPKRHLIHVHNLAAQANVMSMCITLTHPDMPPEEMMSVEQRHAYAMIGAQSSKTALETLEMLAVKAGSARSDVLHGLELVTKIQPQFEADKWELEEGSGAQPALLH
jgi:hypothetical protein